MRYIEKGAEPSALSHRRREIQSTPGVGDQWYDHLDADVRNAIKAQCLQEQMYLCAYTGIRIEMETSHNEHIWPQTECSPEEQIDYTNLVACFNGSRPQDTNPGFGAKQKANWPSRANRADFVKPTERRCETCFLYGQNGHVNPVDSNDTAATETISHLALNCDDLKRWRREALQPLLQIKSLDQLRARVNILKQGRNGRLEEYAYIKLQHLEKRLIRFEKDKKFAAAVHLKNK